MVVIYCYVVKIYMYVSQSVVKLHCSVKGGYTPALFYDVSLKSEPDRFLVCVVCAV
jgi:hypothetical protein